MTKENSVAVLMSTYNGEKFIKNQIVSILEQDNVDVHLFIRDDGSSDGTLKILDTMKSVFSDKITIIIGKNLGYARSFFELMKLSQLDQYEYVAFSDQDDVWKKNKLEIMIRSQVQVSDVNMPKLSFSNGTVTSGTQAIGKLYEKQPPAESIISSRYRAFYGMSFLLNRSLLTVVLNSNIDDISGFGHDDWIMMVAVTTGTVIYVNEELIEYRQHENNVSGIKSTNESEGKIHALIRVFLNIKERLNHWSFVNSANAEYVMNNVPEIFILKEQRLLLDRLVKSNKSFRERMGLFFSSQLSTGSVMQDIILRILLLARRI